MPELPARAGRRRHLLEYVTARFEPGREYREAEVNDLLGEIHDDYATLRRYPSTRGCSSGARESTGALPRRPTCGTPGREARATGERRRAMTAPDQLTLKRHRDLVGRERRPFARWAVLTALGLLCLLGLLNAFGQRPQTHTATASGAELEVYSPERSGAASSCRGSRSAPSARVDARSTPAGSRGSP